MERKGRLKFEHGRWLPSREEATQPALIERETQRREGDSFWAGVLAGAGVITLGWCVVFCLAVVA